jgi:hypothetical protein
MATKKSSPKKSKKVSEESNEPAVKAVGLFDHVNQIKGVQNPKYFDTLSDADKKSFAHVMILKFLSMDRANLDTLSYISKYQDTIPSKNFYTLLISSKLERIDFLMNSINYWHDGLNVRHLKLKSMLKF